MQLDALPPSHPQPGSKNKGRCVIKCYQSAIKSGRNHLRHPAKPLFFNEFDKDRTISAYSHSLKFINSDLWRDLRIRIFKENRRHNLCFPQSVPFFSIKIVSRRYSKIIVDFSSEFKVVLCLFWNSLNRVWILLNYSPQSSQPAP